MDSAHTTCDNKKEDAFTVRMNGKEVKFPRSEDGLCFHKFLKTHEPTVEEKDDVPT